MTESIRIRRAVAADLDRVVAFNQAMARETEGRALADEVIRAGVEGLFYAPHYGFYLVAEAAGQAVGSLMVTFEWSDWRNGLIWWIQSVYVQPDWRRHGIYRRLYRHVKQLAEAQGSVRGFRLYVEKDNAIAQRTYASLGMRESDYRLFEETSD